MIPSAMQSNPTSTHTMKLIAFITLLTSLCPLFAADDSKKVAAPFAEAFFPPELVLMARDRIALTQEQQEAFRARMEKAQPRSDELRMKMERETAALAALAKQERVDEAPLLAQLDVVVASVHAGFSKDEAEMTRRIIKAVENPHVHILGHTFQFESLVKFLSDSYG